MAKLTKKDKIILKEKFIREYAKKKGWNFSSLTVSQMLEVVSQSDYKNPKVS